ncbi:hypothetical protein BDW74DRAFT_175248 [Aspergillus multicolor]|uniref:uncharacterized protein n=1 Tax=Aspergillus multicolor TaxID=41759 RepID=UPI003CCE3F26
MPKGIELPAPLNTQGPIAHYAAANPLDAPLFAAIKANNAGANPDPNPHLHPIDAQSLFPEYTGSLLNYAIRHGDSSITHHLVERGGMHINTGDPSVRGTFPLETAMLYRGEDQLQDMVWSVLKLGADVNQLFHGNQTALGLLFSIRAAGESAFSVDLLAKMTLAFLLQAGVDLEALDVNYGTLPDAGTALTDAIRAEAYLIATQTLEQSPEIDLNKGRPLAMLIRKQKGIWGKGFTGNTILHALIREWPETGAHWDLKDDLRRLKGVADEVGNMVAKGYLNYWIWRVQG